MLYLIIYYSILLGFVFKLFNKITLGQCKSQTCLVGKTAIVTGGNSDIGYQTALGLAGRGCKVVIADVANSEESVRAIVKSTGNENVSWRFVDLGSLESVRRFAKEIVENEERLDILIHNAGCVGYNGVYSEDGLYKVMHINHLGMFLLTHLLVDLLKGTYKSRIIIVSSITSFIANLKSAKDMNKPANLKSVKDVIKRVDGLFNGIQTLLDYSNTKICNLIVSNVFAEKLQKYGVTCNAVYPGVVETPMYQTFYNSWGSSFWKHNFLHVNIGYISKYWAKSPYEGAQTTLHVALSKKLENVTGEYFVDCIKFLQPRLTRNKKFCEEIWNESERLVKLKPEERIQ